MRGSRRGKAALESRSSLSLKRHASRTGSREHPAIHKSDEEILPDPAISRSN